MNIAELFVNLGIKGSEKTVSSLGNVKKGLGEVSSMSLEAKAAIFAAIYALEKLTSASFNAGTDLKNFNTLTGVSARTLQEYQYAASRVGVSNKDVESTFKNLQSTMTKAMLNKDVPQYLGLIGRTLKMNFSQSNMKDFAEHPEKLMLVLQKYAQTEKNIAIRNEALKSFVGEGMIPALDKGVFNPENFKHAPIISDKEIDSLAKGNVALTDLGKHIEMAFAHFNSKHGLQMVQDITHITDAIIKLVEAMLLLGDKLHIFDALSGAINAVATLISPDKEQIKKNINQNKEDQKARSKMSNAEYFQYLKNSLPFVGNAAPNISGKPGGNNHSVNIQNQNLHFQHPGTDHKQNANSHKKAAIDAYRQNPALGRGT